MGIAKNVKAYLDAQNIPYETRKHTHSRSSMETASSSGIPLEKLAKAVMFRDEHKHYLMAVVPSRCRVEISSLNLLTNHDLALAEEKELSRLFDDCELGAIPPFGAAYALPTVWDDTLKIEDDLYMEAGDHEHILHLSRDSFEKLMGNSSHGCFSKPHLFSY